MELINGAILKIKTFYFDPMSEDKYYNVMGNNLPITNQI